MSRAFNETNVWCRRDGVLCEHNLLDSAMIRRNVCSGIGGVCREGSAYSFPPSERQTLTIDEFVVMLRRWATAGQKAAAAGRRLRKKFIEAKKGGEKE